jgi:alkylhydroperoxidase family enzyme
MSCPQIGTARDYNNPKDLNMSSLSKTIENLRNRSNGTNGSAHCAPVPARVTALPPGILRAYVGLEKSLARGHLGERVRRAIAVAVAEINDSESCRAESAQAARRAGLCEEEIALARRASANNAQTDRLLSFVQAVVLQRGHLSPADLEALRDCKLPEPVVVELLADVALNIFKNYLGTVVAGPRPLVAAAR